MSGKIMGMIAMTGVLLAAGVVQAELKKGDRVVFLGDSITEAGAGSADGAGGAATGIVGDESDSRG